MLTRESAKEKVTITKRETYPYNIEDNIDEIIDGLFDQFESQMEQQTCEGCTWFNMLTSDGIITCGVFGKIQSETGFEYDFSCNKHKPKDPK